MTTKQIIDPHFERESKKYKDPIPSREYIISLIANTKTKISIQRLVSLLMIDNPIQKEALRRRIKAMRRDGELLWSRDAGYTLTEQSVCLIGKVIGHKEGFGFCSPEDNSPDIFLSTHQMNLVFPGDRVRVRVIGENRRGKREGVILEVLEHNTKELVGYYIKEGERSFFRPAHPRIHHTIDLTVDKEDQVQSGQVILLKITKQPGLHTPPTGKLLEVLGDADTYGIETIVATYTNQLPHTWPQSIQKELKRLDNPRKSLNTIPRRNLTQLPFVTIDGEDSKDFDDAVYCCADKTGWRLWVAIADVSYYVHLNTTIDKEAANRGNSVYFPHHVIPMLPEKLSNDLCSLKPNVERYCLTCEMVINARGQLKTFEFYPATIESKARLTYTQVSDYLTNNKPLKENHELDQPLKNLETLYHILLNARIKRGAIDIDLPETRVLLDQSGGIEDIIPKNRTISHRIIEECMLMANVSAAKFLLKNKIPTLFRNHEIPPPEKLADFKSFIRQLGLSFGSWFRFTPKPIDFARVLEKVKDSENRQLVQTMLLRTMSQAAYSPENKGHFGLGYPEYTHFTSPIRRYADLIVHRAIYHVLAKQEKQNFYYDQSMLHEIGAHCSMTERRADDATRQVMYSLKCQLMKTQVGNDFTGRITHMMGAGFFVELEQNQVEGLVRLNQISDDHYIFDAKKMIAQGKHSGKSYRLGDKVRVKVARVDTEQNEIDFDIQ